MSNAIQDIIAEMRELSRGGGLCFVGAEGMAEYADRIEAAARREREVAEARQLNECVVVREEEAADWRKRTGNSAVLRKALERLNVLAEELWTGGTGEDMSAEIAEMKDTITAALAAPPRNCDLYQTKVKALEAFDDLYNRGMHCDNVVDAGYWWSFNDWLLSKADAPAQEGGRDGQH